MNKWQVIIMISVFLSCVGNKTINVSTAEEEFHRAKQLLENKKYDKAIEAFKDVIYKYPGSGLMEDAQYWLAKTYFDKKDYEQAELEYKFLLRNFSNSRFAIKAEYELAITYLKQSPPYYLDQTPTKQALKALENFIAKHSGTELAREAEKARIGCIDKLTRKELETARLYKKMGKPDAALLYLNGIEERYPETTLLPEIEQLKRELF